MVWLLKITLVPLLIAAVSLAGRKWGPEFSGLLAGLPWTSGPVLFFLSIERGNPFAVDAANGMVSGVVCLLTFCVVYAWVASRQIPWHLSAACALVAYGISALFLLEADLPMPITFAGVLGVLAITTQAMPRPQIATRNVPSHDLELPLRMACATGVVILLTGTATVLGPRLSGLLAPFPVYAGILAVFAHRQEGGWAAIETLRGVVRGSCSFITFFLVAGVALEGLGVSASFGAATLAAVSLHAVLLDHAVSIRRAGP